MGLFGVNLSLGRYNIKPAWLALLKGIYTRHRYRNNCWPFFSRFQPIPDISHRLFSNRFMTIEHSGKFLSGISQVPINTVLMCMYNVIHCLPYHYCTINHSLYHHTDGTVDEHNVCLPYNRTPEYMYISNLYRHFSLVTQITTPSKISTKGWR